jgi:hypothetical protein
MSTSFASAPTFRSSDRYGYWEMRSVRSRPLRVVRLSLSRIASITCGHLQSVHSALRGFRWRFAGRKGGLAARRQRRSLHPLAPVVEWSRRHHCGPQAAITWSSVFPFRARRIPGRSWRACRSPSGADGLCLWSHLQTRGDSGKSGLAAADLCCSCQKYGRSRASSARE